MKRMTHYFKQSLTMLSLLSLTGCSSLYTETFDCGSKEGVGCKSIAEVDALVNQKASQVTHVETESLSQIGEEESRPYRETGSSVQIKHEEVLTPGFSPPLIVNSTGLVSRVPERWRRVWVAPYQDNEGTFYEGASAYIVVKPGQWRVS